MNVARANKNGVEVVLVPGKGAELGAYDLDLWKWKRSVENRAHQHERERCNGRV